MEWMQLQKVTYIHTVEAFVCSYGCDSLRFVIKDNLLVGVCQIKLRSLEKQFLLHVMHTDSSWIIIWTENGSRVTFIHRIFTEVAAPSSVTVWVGLMPGFDYLLAFWQRTAFTVASDNLLVEIDIFVLSSALVTGLFPQMTCRRLIPRPRCVYLVPTFSLADNSFIFLFAASSESRSLQALNCRKATFPPTTRAAVIFLFAIPQTWQSLNISFIQSSSPKLLCLASCFRFVIHIVIVLCGDWTCTKNIVWPLTMQAGNKGATISILFTVSATRSKGHEEVVRFSGECIHYNVWSKI